jgi:hypothetical protein
MALGFLFRCLAVQTLLFAPTGAREHTPLHRRNLYAKLFGGAAFSTVQQAILAGVILRLPMRHCQSIQKLIKFVQRLSSSLQV